jgi:hypothetical protein
MDEFRCNTNGEWITMDEAFIVWPADRPRPVDIAGAWQVTCERCADHHVARNGMQAEQIG